MPVYNGASFLREAIQSVLDQTFSDFSFLIINDGSTDKSDKIIKKFNDRRIRYVSHEFNRGLIATLNEGLELATGEYIIRMDADDISFPQRFEKQIAFMEANPDIAISGTSLSVIGSNELIAYPETNEACKVMLLYNTVMGHPSVIMRREQILAAGLKFDCTALHAEDYKFWTDAEIKGLKIGNLAEALVAYRKHGGQISAVAYERQQETVRQVRLEYVRHFFGEIIDGNARVYKAFSEKAINTFVDFKAAVEIMGAMQEENNQKKYFDTVAFNLYMNDLLQSAAFRIYVLCTDCNLSKLKQAFFDRYFYKTTTLPQKAKFIFRSIKNTFS